MNLKQKTDLMWKCLAVAIFSTCTITACSNDGNESPPTLSFMTATDSALSTAQQISAERYVKNGIYLMKKSQATAVEGTADDTAAPASYSTTNTQIAGVDEADRIEYNGDYLFVADLPVWTPSHGEVKKVRILARQNDYSLTEAATISLQENLNVAGMYLYEDILGVVSHSFQYYAMADILLDSSPWQQPENDTYIDIYGVAEPASPNTVSNIRIDGGLINSRRIDNHLFIATQFVPNLEDLPDAGTSNRSLVDLYNAILAKDSSELVPKITINGQTSDLYQLTDCLLPQRATEHNGHTQMVSVVKINLDNPMNFSSLCLLTEAHGLFASADHLYLHARGEESTIVHKISLGNEIRYQATASVVGTLGWQSSAQFRLAERDGKLLAVTTVGAWSQDPEHMLHILEQQGSELVEIATLPNESQPAPIGKPGEAIYAVRFFEDRAFIVTFEQVDPLYVIDLTDLYAPRVAGELEIPGFSSYLHPMENGLLLGVGQQVRNDAIPVSGSTPLETPIEEGMKVSLFDVLDPANPVVLGEFVWPEAYTPVEYDHRSLSVLKTDSGYQFALPSQSWGFDDSGYWFTQNALQTLVVNEADRTLSLIDSISPATEDDYYIGSYEDRSVLHNGHIYYLRGNKVYHTLWQPGATVDGPY